MNINGITAHNHNKATKMQAECMIVAKKNELQNNAKTQNPPLAKRERCKPPNGFNPQAGFHHTCNSLMPQ